MAGTNLRALLERVNQQVMQHVDDALTKEVFRAVQDAEIDAIIDTVYNAYKPKVYKGRGSDGGMEDPQNIVIRGASASGGTLVVVNVTPPNPDGYGKERGDEESVTTDKVLPELIEYGDGYKGYQYDFKKENASYMKPRSFTQSTIETLNAGRAYIEAMRAGLKRQGLDVR